ncbi:Serine/threonine-protein kinase KIN4 [Nakaseomyces bracarensis]|uniref:non-specific serine/threonine protein kinase n=1 Tax=Nakaseomyces bracarensis TaxID=273131 RepID=A0ABR4NU73_9SACH
MTSYKRHTYYGGGSLNYHQPNLKDDNQTRPTSAISASTIRPRKHVTFGPYIIGATIGEGEFGKVKLAWSKPSTVSNSKYDKQDLSINPNDLKVSKQVAIKLIKRNFINNDPTKETKIYREINALKHLSHPNIVKLEEVLQNSKYIGIVLEYASGGEFYKYIQKKRRLKEQTACRLFSQLISAVHYIHSKGLVHRDLKLENLLLDNEENLIITDFGFVNEFVRQNGLMKTSCGSPCYAAPELVISSRPYDARKADTWSCGVILFAMLAGYLPWDDDEKNPDGHDISRLYDYIINSPLKFPEYISPVPRDLLRRILVIDAKKRISIRMIAKHQWLQSQSTFLSITPEEWDKISNTKNIYRNPSNRVRSNIRPNSNYSNHSSCSRDNKRDSLIIDSALVSLPAPPKEFQSHILTKPSSVVSETRYSPMHRKGHNRSNSAASLALQAVVDAADKEYLKNYESPEIKVIRSESTSSRGSNEIKPELNNMIVAPSPNIIVSGKQKLTSKNTVRKPRPTSFQPTSSHFNNSTSNIYGLMIRDNSTASSHQASISSESHIFDSPPSLQPDTTKSPTSSAGSSPKILPRRSFTVSKPLLDLKVASADLIQSTDSSESLSKRIHEHIYDVEHRPRRHSYRYSGIISDLIFGTLVEEAETNTHVDTKESSITTEEAEVSSNETHRDTPLEVSSHANSGTSSPVKNTDIMQQRSTSSNHNKKLAPHRRAGFHSDAFDKRYLRPIKPDVQNQKDNSNLNKRNTLMLSNEEKRTSTAKRVFDFFKRRSMKV